MTETGILLILLRQKRLLLASGIVMACFGFAVSRTLPLSYLSQGNLVVENPPSISQNQTSPTAIDNVSTQVDVLQSKGLIQRVVRDFSLTQVASLEPAARLPAPVTRALASVVEYVRGLKHLLDDSPQQSGNGTDATVTYVQKHLGVSAKDNSSVILVSFEAGSPDISAKVVNAVMATYLAAVAATREIEMAKAEQWISQQMVVHRSEVDTAERRITQFVQAHNIPEVQGSLTAAIQLSKDQEQLILARVDLTRNEASLSTVTHGDAVNGALETLDSKTIQDLKQAEARVIGQIGFMNPLDPRRGSLQSELNSIRARIPRVV
jgi:polysaccharide biosynthesis transport protein